MQKNRRMWAYLFVVYYTPSHSRVKYLLPPCPSVRPSVRPSVSVRTYQFSAHRTDFRLIWYKETFTKIYKENPYLFKIGRKRRILYLKPQIRLYC